MLTPLEIENKKFPTKFKEYDDVEVDTFLDQIIIDYEKLYKENNELKLQIEKLKSQMEENEKDLEHFRSVGNTLQNTLIMAQSTAEDIKASAQNRAEQIIRDAESKARRTTEEITKEEFEIKKRTEELKRQFDVYKAKMEALLISQLELLKDNNQDNE